MNEDYTNDPLEILNKEYLELIQSKDLATGELVNGLMYGIRHGNLRIVRGFLQKISAQRKIKKLSKKNVVHRNAYVYSKTDGSISTDDCVVYTCVTGGYDKNIQEPYTKKQDFIYYTEAGSQLKSENWIIKPIEELNLTGNQINRFYKFHPAKYVGSYRYSMYIDGNVKIISDITPFFYAAKESKWGIAMHAHSERNCVYKEAKACLFYKRGNADAIANQMEFYRKEGLPDEFGLCMAAVIVVDNQNPHSKLILDAWWDEFMRSKSGRDQLAFPYVIWKLGYKIEDFTLLGENIYLNPKFRFFNISDHKE